MSTVMATGPVIDFLPRKRLSWSSSISRAVDGSSSFLRSYSSRQKSSCSSRRFRGVTFASASGSRFRDEAKSAERDSYGGPRDVFGSTNGRGRGSGRGRGRGSGERDFRNTDQRDFRGTDHRDSRGRESSQYRGRDSRELDDGPRRNFGEGRYSSYNNEGSSSRGYGRGNSFARGSGAFWKKKKKGLHAGAYEMLDEATGETVIVWGVEGLEPPKPSAENLNWEPAKVVASGVVSDETWYKAMEASMDGPLGAYSVRGVVQGRVRGGEDDDLGIEDSSDDDALDRDEDSEDVEDEDEDDEGEDSEDDEGEDDYSGKGQKTSSTITRPPRVKVFGRDFGGIKNVESKLQSNITDYISSASIPAPSGPIDDRAADEPVLVDKLAEYEWGRRLKSEQQEVSGKVEEGEANEGKEDEAALDEGDEEETENEDQEVETQDEDEEDTETEDEEDTEDLDAEDEVEEEEEVLPRDLRGFEQRREANLRPALSDNAVRASTLSSKTGRKDKYLESELSELENLYPDGGIVEIIEEAASRESPNRIHSSSKEEKSMTRNFFDKLRYDTQSTKGAKSAADDLDQPLTKIKNQKREQSTENEGQVSFQTTLNRQARNNYDAALSSSFFSPKSFASIGASDEIIQSLRALNVKRPSDIQAMAYKSVLEGESCIIADQTGSGKTLAYLAPLVQYIRQKEKTHGKSAPNKPRIVVLVPTNELANQVLSVCRTMSRSGLPFRSLLVTGGFKWKTQVEGLQQGADILVATPGRFLKHLEEGNVKLDDLRSLVVDEADILYDDEEFSESLQTINMSAPIQIQYIHVTATLPRDVHDRLLQMYPDCESFMGPSLHRTAIGLQEVLVDCSEADGNEKTPETAFLAKKVALLQLVEQRPVSKTIIFCNKIETCRKVENVLNRYDRSSDKIAVIPHHAALSQEARAKSLEQFLNSKPDKPVFLVCTDRASRGLDSIDVEHVVLFDFPRDPSEYVRRVGRTARGAGGTGKAYVFVVGKQVSLARRIMTRNEKGHPIHSVPSSFY